MSRKFTRLATLLCIAFVAAPAAVLANDNPAGKSKRQTKLVIKAAPWGPTQQDVDSAIARVEASGSLQSQVSGSQYRRLSFEYLEAADKPGSSQPPTRFRIVYYDYTRDRTLVAESDFAARDAVVVSEAAFQPIASPEEFKAAAEIVRNDPVIAAAFRDGKLKVFEPMPDITVFQGTIERLINVGVHAEDSERSEIVSVSLRRGTVVRHQSGAPPSAVSAPDSCGIANSNQGSTGRGIAGQATITLTEGPTTLWEMIVIRPSASSGTRASGVEIRDVKYRGKSVLKRGHVPILNVQYVPQTCGPYRDWQYAEGFFNAPAAGSQNPAPGIRVLASGQVATTAIETGSDTGDFQGVAAYVDHGELIVVSEMNADWYRYIMEWRFSTNGTIRPRFGFGAVKNGCVCNVHNHHVFWRLDFDVVQPNNKVFRIERGRKFLTPLAAEMKQLKSAPLNRGLLIQNANGNEAYELIPNLFDGVADAFGVSDMWVLRHKNVTGGTAFQNELDDGFNQTTSQNAFIQIDQFINGESISGQDVVVWYGAHFVHADGMNIWNPSRSPEHLEGDHVVGPDIRAVRW